MLKPPTKLELAEQQLGSDLGEWVRAHRRDDRSWTWIANRLATETHVQVTHEWLRRLFTEDAETGVA